MRQSAGLLLLAAAIGLEPLRVFSNGWLPMLPLAAYAGGLWVLARDRAMWRGLLPGLMLLLLWMPLFGGVGGGSSTFGDGTQATYRAVGAVRVPDALGEAGAGFLSATAFLASTLAAMLVVFGAREPVRAPRPLLAVLALGAAGVALHTLGAVAGIDEGGRLAVMAWSGGMWMLWIVHGGMPLALAWEAYLRTEPPMNPREASAPA